MVFKALVEECTLRNYSKRTIKTYLHYNKQFLKIIKKQPHEISQKDIRSYLLILIKWGRSPTTINLAHNALLFYYSQILKRRFHDIPFQKIPEKAKETLTKEEIKTLIDVTTNPKHKLIIKILYATGMRVSELVKLKVQDIDFARELILIKSGKGNKDRYSILSKSVCAELQEFSKNKRSTEYLLATEKSHLTIRTIQAILKNAQKKSKIQKRVTPHILRHSFATHLRDAGVQDSDIQKLLGHQDIKTTRTYAKVSVEHLRAIQSPCTF